MAFGGSEWGLWWSNRHAVWSRSLPQQYGMYFAQLLRRIIGLNIYNDKIAILSYTDLVGVIIQNQALADMQRSIFNLSFQIAKSVMASRGS